MDATRVESEHVENPETFPVVKTVLAPIDFSRVSERVIETAIDLARASDARLVLLYVVAPILPVGGPIALKLARVEFAEEEKRTTARILTQIQRSLRDEGVTAHVLQFSGEPRECIIEQATRLSADTIVMGSHGHGAFYDTVMGSTARGVVKRATCPVVIVPSCSPDRKTRLESDREETGLAADFCVALRGSAGIPPLPRRATTEAFPKFAAAQLSRKQGLKVAQASLPAFPTDAGWKPALQGALFLPVTG